MERMEVVPFSCSQSPKDSFRIEKEPLLKAENTNC